MKMNKNILWMVFGTMLLTGCPDDVMQQRKYVPADDPSGTGKAPVTDVSPDPEDVSSRSKVTVEERTASASEKSTAGTADVKQQGQPSEFQPMTEHFDNSGVSSGDAEVAGAGEYIVRSGDTLGKIAAAHHVGLSALMKANKLTEKDAKHLRVGKKLVIPGGKAAASNGSRSAKTQKGKSGKKAQVKAEKASIQPGEYIVKSGDSPERIARRAKVRLKDLMAANHLTEESAKRLRVGQKLVIPGPGKAVAVKKPAKRNVKTAAASTGDATGADVTAPTAGPAAPTADVAGAGSAAAGATDDPALAGNAAQSKPAQTPAVVPAQPGADTAAPAADTGKEPPVVEVPEDISINDFAKKYNTTPEALRGANLDLGDTIKKGQWIVIPR